MRNRLRHRRHRKHTNKACRHDPWWHRNNSPTAALRSGRWTIHASMVTAQILPNFDCMPARQDLFVTAELHRMAASKALSALSWMAVALCGAGLVDDMPTPCHAHLAPSHPARLVSEAATIKSWRRPAGWPPGVTSHLQQGPHSLDTTNVLAPAHIAVSAVRRPSLRPYGRCPCSGSAPLAACTRHTHQCP